MRKIFIILIITILIFGCSLPVFAVNGLSIDSYLSEPVPSDNVAYFAIGSSASDARLYAFFINPGQGSIQIEQNFDNGKWSFFIYKRMPDGSLSTNFPVWVGRYNLIDGTCYDLKYYSSSGSTSHTNYHNITLTLTVSDRPYYWFSGNITCTNYNGIIPEESFNPSFMQISWNGTGQALLDIKGQITAIQLVMSSLYNRVDLTYQDVDAILQLLSNHYNWFETTYYNSILDKWIITNDYLDDVCYYLVSIYNDLIHDNGETLPDQSQFNSDVDSYISNEHQYIDNFDSQMNNIQGSFDQVSSDMNSFSSAFAFIGNVFNSFIPAGSLPYIFIFISLTFGLIVLILGKQRS